MNSQQPTFKIEQPTENSGASSLDFVRSLWPAWLYWLLPPLPAILFWHSHNGRFIALCLFFVSCTSLVASVFNADFTNPTGLAVGIGRPNKAWRLRMVFLGLALLSQWAIFAVLCLSLNDAHDIMAPVLALGSLIPSLSIAPCLTLVTRKPFAAVVLTLFLVGSMKILGCVIVDLAYGWHADAQGYTTLTWTHPNLLVWLFWLNTGLLCLSLYIFGRKRFIRDLTKPPGSGLSSVRY